MYGRHFAISSEESDRRKGKLHAVYAQSTMKRRYFAVVICVDKLILPANRSIRVAHFASFWQPPAVALEICTPDLRSVIRG